MVVIEKDVVLLKAKSFEELKDEYKNAVKLLSTPLKFLRYKRTNKEYQALYTFAN